MATFSGFCLRAFVASRLESAVKQVGGSGGDRDGGGGIRVGDAEVCAHVCAWGALHAADQAGRRGGIGRRRRRQGQRHGTGTQEIFYREGAWAKFSACE